MMNELKKNELNEQEMENVSGGASLGDLFDAVSDIVSDAVGSAFDTVADAAGTVIDVVEYAWEHGNNL